MCHIRSTVGAASSASGAARRLPREEGTGYEHMPEQAMHHPLSSAACRARSQQVNTGIRSPPSPLAGCTPLCVLHVRARNLLCPPRPLWFSLSVPFHPQIQLQKQVMSSSSTSGAARRLPCEEQTGYEYRRARARESSNAHRL